MPGLLNDNAQQTVQTPLEEQQPGTPGAATSRGEAGAGGLSFTSEQVENGVREQFKGDELDDLDQVIAAGHKILFGKDTHYKIIDSLQNKEGIQLSDELAQGAVSMTYILHEESGGTVPAQLLAPAVTVLLARVSEFLNEAGLATVTDEVFSEALQTYALKIRADNDPEFAEKAGYNKGQPGQESGTGQPVQQQPAPATGGGLLQTPNQRGM